MAIHEWDYPYGRNQLEQSADEQIAYKIDTTKWGGSPSSPTCKAYDMALGGTDVTTTVYPTNSPSVSSDEIDLSLLKLLTKGHTYRIEVKWTDGDSNIVESFGIVKCAF